MQVSSGELPDETFWHSTRCLCQPVLNFASSQYTLWPVRRCSKSPLLSIPSGQPFLSKAYLRAEHGCMEQHADMPESAWPACLMACLSDPRVI